ncbi:MAG: hypothetical protein GXP54_12525 [Deltaproteobacteria bacterium]|nr:hypothetical protein [Deltaproteobacteria bacterium]
MQAVFHRSVAWLAAALIGLSACGGSAVSFIASTAIERAEVELLDARRIKADKDAPYQYTKADLYVKMAKERLGYADYQAVQQYAEDALKLATEAKKVARESRRLKKLREAGPGQGSGWGPSGGKGR